MRNPPLGWIIIVGVIAICSLAFVQNNDKPIELIGVIITNLITAHYSFKRGQGNE